MVHLPVGSNVPDVGTPAAEARLHLGVDASVFTLGLFGHAHATRGLAELRGVANAVAAASGREAVIVYTGPDTDRVRAAAGGVRVLAPGGVVEGREVSRRLAATDLFLSVHTDGVSTRRGSMMAALQHGLCVLGTDGESTGPGLRAEAGRSLTLVPADLGDGLASAAARLARDPIRRAALGASGRLLYRQRFDWPVTAATLRREVLG